MLNDITLTSYGEILRPYPGTENIEDIELTHCIGIHAVCESWIDIRQVTPEHYALICRRCKLRVVIPITVDSWKKLEGHFKLRLADPDEYARLRS